MAVNLNIIIPLILAAVCLMIWLAYRNIKDENKFESDMDKKDDLDEKKYRKK
jgi:hypothetical protein